MRAAAAIDAGKFDEEIVPLESVKGILNKETKETAIVEGTVERDECNRPETTLEGLAKLKPAFEEGDLLFELLEPHPGPLALFRLVLFGGWACVSVFSSYG